MKQLFLKLFASDGQVEQLQKQMRDYLEGGMRLVWQRQAIFSAATILAAFYFDVWTAFFCFGLVQLSEFYDLVLTRVVFKADIQTRAQVNRFLWRIVLGTILSAGAISYFAITIAHLEGVSTHFTALFFLFAAALFAAMNNHQLVAILALRLVIYSIAFLFIPLRDILAVSPPIESELWLQFFTVLFVLYFVVDCSFIFLRLYRDNLRQFEDLKAEHNRTKTALAAKTEFLATVSHELRTPLTSMKASLGLVNSGVLGEISGKVSTVLKIAENNSSRLADVINELLDLQSIDSDEITYDMKPLNLQDLLEEIVLSNKMIAKQKAVQLELAGHAQNLIVSVDKEKMTQVIENLISNAIKFSTKSGKIELSLGANERHTFINVQDFGVGIPMGQEEAVFGLFSQVDGSDQRQFGGIGLGLNISQKIVIRHGGTLTYKSKLGSGTVFTVSLPLLEQQDLQIETRPRSA